MLLDFMSYTALRLRTHCGSEWTAADLTAGRVAIQIEINASNAGYLQGDDQWAQTLCGIVANSGPLTTLPPWMTSTHGRVPIPSQLRTQSTKTYPTHQRCTAIALISDALRNFTLRLLPRPTRHLSATLPLHHFSPTGNSLAHHLLTYVTHPIHGNAQS
jgi:hypothetical protein